MSVSVTMPRLGESVTEGTITRWLKQEGEEVQADEPLLEVSTDKVDTEVPAPASGVLLSIRAQEDETVEVGAEIAVIGDSSESGGRPAEGDSQAASAAETEEAQQPPQEAAQTPPQQDAPEQQAQAEQADQKEQKEEAPAPQAEQSAAPEGDGSKGGGGGEGGISVLLPALGESVSEGTVTRWLKQEGEQVQADEPLLEVSTDKVDTEIPSPASGVLLSIRVHEDETVDVGTELAVIGEPGAKGAAASTPMEQQPAPQQADGQTEAPPQPAPEQAPQQTEQIDAPPQDSAEQEQPVVEQSGRDDYSGHPDLEAAPQQPPAAMQQQAATQQPAPAPSAQEDGRAGDGSGAYVTPLVRKLAAEHDVDLSQLSGSGVGGRIRKQDVLDAAREQQARQPQEAPAPSEQPARPPTPAAEQAQPAAAAAAPRPTTEPSPLRGRTEKMSRLRRVIADRMVQSLQTSAQLTTVVEVDVTNIARLRDRAKDEFARREGVRLSFLPIFAKATIEALKEHPKLNASIDSEQGTITYHDAEHLGIAVDTERGLLVPVIQNAGDLNIAGLARKIADLAERTRSNRVSPDELGGGTFTLTNTGSRGALFDTPIINQPQVGILGTGIVVKRPEVVTHPELGETIAVRSVAYFALSYDHRLVDGADGARFLVTVKNRLEEGDFAAELGLT